jgi:hypothetical protein
MFFMIEAGVRLEAGNGGDCPRWQNIKSGNLAGTKLVSELHTHAPNWFPPEKVILLGIAKLVPI